MTKDTTTMKLINKKISKILLIVFLLLSNKSINAQNWDWAEHVSGTSSIEIEALVKSSTSVYSSGTFQGTATFISAPNPENNLTTSQSGGFVLCHSQNGELIWANIFEATNSVKIKGLTIDDQENVYITGSYSGTSATFFSLNSEDDVLLGESQNHDTFIAKYDSNGNLIRAEVVAQSSDLDRGFGIQTDGLGNIYIGGFWRGGNLNFLSSSISIPYNSTINWGNGFVAKFNSDLTPVWVSTIVGGSNEGGVARVNGGISLAKDNGIYASGPFQKTVFFDKTYYADGSEIVLPETTYTAGTSIAQDVITFKLNSDGSFGWARHLSNFDNAANSGNYITSNVDNGDVYFIGNFVGSITIENDPSSDPVILSSNGGEDNFIVKYDSNGIIDWAYSFGGLSNEGANDISLSNDIVTVSGYFSGNIYLGSSIGAKDTLVSAGGTDAFLINLSSDGNYLSSTNLKGTLNEDMLCLDSDNLSNVTVGGYFSSPTFNIGEIELINGGSSDGFLAHHINIHILPTISEITCSEGHDGTLSLEVFGGGEEPYTYTLNKVAGNEIDAGTYSDVLHYTDLESGEYRFVVTDNLGRSVTKFYHLISPEPILIDGTVTDVNGCHGNENGEISLSVSGGVGDYTYFWDTPNGYGLVPNAQNQSSLTAGTYEVTVTDANGCTASESFEIVQPDEIHFDGSIITDNTSSDPLNPNGAIDLMVNNGTGPFIFSWKGPNGYESSDEDLNNIRGGTYILSVEDANGCTATTSFNVADEHLFNAWITETINPKCKGGSDGSATVAFDNTTGGISVEWSNGETDVITATNLNAGEYSVTLTDDMGTPGDPGDDVTISLMPVLIGEPSFALDVTPTVTKTTCPSDNDGSIQLTVNGWSQPYNFSWSTSDGSGLVDGQKDQFDLTVGSYTYSVTDKYGCEVGSSVNLQSNYSNPSFTLGVSPSADVCEGTEVVFTASEGFSYLFYIDDTPQGDFSSENTLTIPDPVDGTRVSVIGMNTAGCTSESEEITLTVTSNVGVPTFTQGSNIICEGQNETYQATADNAESIEYSIVAGTANINSTTGDVSNIQSDFTVRASAFGLNGCGEEFVDMEVTLQNLPTPTISTTDPLEWTEGEAISVLFTVDITDADAYQWLKDGGAITDATQTTYTATEADIYNVLVTINGCEGMSNPLEITVVPPETYTVTFNITNSADDPIEGADITVDDLNPISTDNQGVATIDLEDGNYSYVVDANNYNQYTGSFEVAGSDTPVNVQMVEVGINTQELLNVSAYPNPFGSEITISNPERVSNVVITSISGQKVLEVTLDNNRTINTSTLPAGVYLLKLYGHEGKSSIFRMVKE